MTTNGTLKDYPIERFFNRTWKEIKRDFKTMMKWLLFYEPKDTADKVWHFIEVMCAWVIITKIIYGF